MQKYEYDFINWSSFPSSRKVINDESTDFWAFGFGWFPVTPRSIIKVEFMAKGENIIGGRVSRIAIDGKDVNGVEARIRAGGDLFLPSGSFKWGKFETSLIVPSNVTSIRVLFLGGNGTPALTWYDDLKIYQNGALIFEDKFSNWTPYILGGGLAVAGGVAGYAWKKKPIPALVGAVAGAGLGYGVGYVMAKP